MTIQILLTRTILRKSLVSLQLRKRHNYIFAFHVTLMCAVSQVTMIFAIVEYEASEKYQNFQFFYFKQKAFEAYLSRSVGFFQRWELMSDKIQTLPFEVFMALVVTAKMIPPPEPFLVLKGWSLIISSLEPLITPSSTTKDMNMISRS